MFWLYTRTKRSLRSLSFQEGSTLRRQGLLNKFKKDANLSSEIKVDDLTPSLNKKNSSDSRRNIISNEICIDNDEQKAETQMINTAAQSTNSQKNILGPDFCSVSCQSNNGEVRKPNDINIHENQEQTNNSDSKPDECENKTQILDGIKSQVQEQNPQKQLNNSFKINNSDQSMSEERVASFQGSSNTREHSLHQKNIDNKDVIERVSHDKDARQVDKDTHSQTTLKSKQESTQNEENKDFSNNQVNIPKPAPRSTAQGTIITKNTYLYNHLVTALNSNFIF